MERNGTSGSTPLMIAVAFGNAGIARQLLTYGASPEKIDMEGSNALHIAARDNQTDIIRLLLASTRANTMRGQRNMLGATPLFEAVVTGATEAMELLAPKTTDLRGCFENGDTLLHVAACSEHPESVRWLLERGMNPSASNRLGITPCTTPPMMATNKSLTSYSKPEPPRKPSMQITYGLCI